MGFGWRPLCRNCSFRFEQCLAAERGSDRLVGVPAMPGGGADHRANAGEEVTPQSERNPPVTLR